MCSNKTQKTTSQNPIHFLTQTCFLFVSWVLCDHKEIKISAMQSPSRKAGLLAGPARPQHCCSSISCTTGKPRPASWLSQLQTRAPLSSSLCPLTQRYSHSACTAAANLSGFITSLQDEVPKRNEPLELSRDTGLSFPRPWKNSKPRRRLIHITKSKGDKSPHQMPLDIRKHHCWPHLAHENFRRIRTVWAWLNEN